MARVDFDYSKEEEGELSIRRGDIIVLLDNSDEQWWYGETNGSVGYFPASYVTILNTVQATQDDEIARRNSLTVSKESKWARWICSARSFSRRLICDWLILVVIIGVRVLYIINSIFAAKINSLWNLKL